MDYSKMAETDLEVLIVEECLKQNITEPKAQMQYIAETNKPLFDAFMDKITKAE